MGLLKVLQITDMIHVELPEGWAVFGAQVYEFDFHLSGSIYRVHCMLHSFNVPFQNQLVMMALVAGIRKPYVNSSYFERAICIEDFI